LPALMIVPNAVEPIMPLESLSGGVLLSPVATLLDVLCRASFDAS
jgi:hypothetical protein